MNARIKCLINKIFKTIEYDVRRIIMVLTRNPKTLDNETFEWIEEQKVLKDNKSKVGRPESPLKTAAKRRQRYFRIRKVARKEIADLVKLVKKLPEKQFEQIFNIDRIKPQPYAETEKEKNELQEKTKSVDDLPELVFSFLRYPSFRHDKPSINRAEIARLFIEWGFEYLCEMAPDLMTLSHEQTRVAALDLANFLTESFKQKSERFYSRPPTQSGYGY